MHFRIERVARQYDYSDAYRFSLDLPDGECFYTDIVYRERGVEPLQNTYHIVQQGISEVMKKFEMLLLDKTIEKMRNSGGNPEFEYPRNPRSDPYHHHQALPTDFNELRSMSMGRVGMPDMQIDRGMTKNKKIKSYSLGVSEKEQRAAYLLRSTIGADNFNNLINDGFFTHEGAYGMYELYCDDAAGVRLIQKHNIGDERSVPISWTLCIQAATPLPKGDLILARYLEIKNNEVEFLKTANIRAVKTTDEAVVGREEFVQNAM